MYSIKRIVSMHCQTYEETRNGEHYVYAFSDVWTERGRVEAVELTVYRDERLISSLQFPGDREQATAAAWRYIERIN